MEKYRARKRDLRMIFIKLEKTYIKVPRKILWWAMTKDIPKKYINSARYVSRNKEKC